LVFTTPIGLHSDDLSAKESLNQVLEVSEALKHFRFMFKSTNPHILAQVIYEAYIVFFLPMNSGAGSQTSEKLSPMEQWRC
jgi:hypothetical protein